MSFASLLWSSRFGFGRAACGLLEPGPARAYHVDRPLRVGMASPDSHMNDESIRVREERLIDRCLAAARSDSVDAQDEREANVFRLAAVVIEPKFLAESKRLRAAAARFFACRSSLPLPVEEALDKAWIRSLPWLHDALVQRLGYPIKAAIWRGRPSASMGPDG